MAGINYKHITGSPAYSFQRAQKRLLLNTSGDQHNNASPAHSSNETYQIRQQRKFNFDILKLAESVRGKLSLGAKILQLGGIQKVFKQNFSFKHGEKLLKASPCYLSTTSGPIQGILFISTDKVAFCSERSIKILSSSGKSLKIRYKVSIPLRKLKQANASLNLKNPSQKYVEIVTEDNFDFWFMGFLNHRRTLRCLQQAITWCFTQTRGCP